jgi:hypothetical protein
MGAVARNTFIAIQHYRSISIFNKIKNFLTVKQLLNAVSYFIVIFLWVAQTAVMKNDFRRLWHGALRMSSWNRKRLGTTDLEELQASRGFISPLCASVASNGTCDQLSPSRFRQVPVGLLGSAPSRVSLIGRPEASAYGPRPTDSKLDIQASLLMMTSHSLRVISVWGIKRTRPLTPF